MPGRLYPENYEGQAPKEFGIDANVLKTRTFNLAVARDLEQIDIGGSCIWAVAATSLGASIDIRINDQLRDPVTFQQGMFIRGVPFSRLYVSHEAQAGETITIFFAREQDVRNIEIVNPAIAFTEVDLTKANTYVSNNDVAMIAGATTVIQGANILRRVVYITNLAANLATLRISGNAAINRGTPLAPGETLIITTTAGIVGYNPGAVDQNVALSYTED